MASIALDHSFLTLDQQLVSLRGEIKKQMDTVDRLNRQYHETGDATQHLESLRQQYWSLAQSATHQRKP